MVLGAKPAPRRYDEETDNEDNSRGSYSPDFNRAKQVVESAVASTPVASASEDEDDALSYFQKLAEE